VDRQFGSPLFQRNVLSTPAGGLAGAAKSASQGLIVSSNILVIITVPVGAAIGAAGESKFNASTRRREQRSTS
jgi:hypothetical protein